MTSVSEIDKKIEHLKAQKKALIAKVKDKERKERTRRLIQIGAIVEKYTGKIDSLEAWEKHIQDYAEYIKKSQAKAVATKNAELEALEMPEKPNPEVQNLLLKSLASTEKNNAKKN